MSFACGVNLCVEAYEVSTHIPDNETEDAS
jgi:hypothetical protein